MKEVSIRHSDVVKSNYFHNRHATVTKISKESHRVQSNKSSYADTVNRLIVNLFRTGTNQRERWILQLRFSLARSISHKEIVVCLK